MTEAQKYDGGVRWEKAKRKSVTISDPAQISRQPYVEDAPDADDGTLAIISVPPQAPSPPPSAPPTLPSKPVNVFDFLVDDETPNASRVSVAASKEPMRMVEHAPPIFQTATPSPQEKDDEKFRERGYSYGVQPVHAQSNHYETPAPKAYMYQVSNETKSTDKKRKRQVEDLDLTQARRPSQEMDEEMDVDGSAEVSEAPVLHSGLTGGLNKLLSSSKFPPSPDYSGSSGADIVTISPARRNRPAGSVVSAATAAGGRGRARGGRGAGLAGGRPAAGRGWRAPRRARPRRRRRRRWGQGRANARPQHESRAIGARP